MLKLGLISLLLVLLSLFLVTKFLLLAVIIYAIGLSLGVVTLLLTIFSNTVHEEVVVNDEVNDL